MSATNARNETMNVNEKLAAFVESELGGDWDELADLLPMADDYRRQQAGMTVPFAPKLTDGPLKAIVEEFGIEAVNAAEALGLED